MKLKSWGCFGEDLEKAERKERNRRGPLDRQLTDLGLEKHDKPISILTLHEAFFLAHSLDCLSLHSDKQEILTIEFCWSLFRDYHKHSNLQLDFAIEYGVYHYFRTRGWVVKSGTNYGTNFLLYKEGPSIDHAQYAVIISCESDEMDIKSRGWNSLLTYHRVVQTVCKELLLVFLVLPQMSDLKFEEPTCIKNMKLTTRTFSSQSNSPPQA